MTAITEKAHAGEFILSLGNGNVSIDNGTLASGQNLPAGAVLQLSGGNWTEVLGGDEADAAGVLLSAVDATDGALPCAVVVRQAEVSGPQLQWNDGSPAVDTDAASAALTALGIVVRD